MSEERQNLCPADEDGTLVPSVRATCGQARSDSETWYKFKKTHDAEYLNRIKEKRREERARAKEEARLKEQERLLKITMEIERNKRYCRLK